MVKNTKLHHHPVFHIREWKKCPGFIIGKRIHKCRTEFRSNTATLCSDCVTLKREWELKYTI